MCSSSIFQRSRAASLRNCISKIACAWISLNRKEGETPARVSIRVDPAGLGSGKHLGTVQFSDESGTGPILQVALQIGGSPAITVAGRGCAVDDRTLHASAGAGCSLQIADGEAIWVLPGGGSARGSRLHAQFLRRGRFEILVDGESIPVLIE